MVGAEGGSWVVGPSGGGVGAVKPYVDMCMYTQAELRFIPDYSSQEKHSGMLNNETVYRNKKRMVVAS